MYVGTVQPGLQVLQSQLVCWVPAGIKLPGLPELAETTGIMRVGGLYLVQRQGSLDLPM